MAISKTSGIIKALIWSRQLTLVPYRNKHDSEKELRSLCLWMVMLGRFCSAWLRLKLNTKIGLHTTHPGISETDFLISRPSPRLEFSESQFRDWVRDSNFLSLSFETESETEVFIVLISRPSPRLKFSESQFRDRVRDCKFQSLNFETESETQFFKSQFRDRVRDWHFLSLNIETESETGIL